ncbi:immunoglobulin I-set domain protein [Ancylostoma duodenale]|uniref:Immunoglobulin I-set domain protein n=1 Tax=Ancylostoma duodenale TaxID=51022 RepID=A0A0C2GKN5_9BILA|nr:immunoglobulin I-set domain protein [Ancylostoma duodenale]
MGNCSNPSSCKALRICDIFTYEKQVWKMREVIPVIEDGERVIQVKENNTLSIDCAAGGIPPPQITWKKDGQPLDEVQGGRLTVPHATASDAGRYTCTARNEAGSVSADFAVDVFSRPRFKDIKTEVQVIDGDRARLECKVEGHPAPTVRWLRGGRPIEDMSNFILSPRGETLMILKARRADAGSYSCVAKNAAGESEAGFTVSVFTAPHIEESVDQNPHIVQGKTLTFYCPVLGNPDPKKEDEGRYTCHAFNEAGILDTDYESEVIAPPKFHRTGESVYEVVEHETVTLDCAVATEPKPEVIWYRGEQPLYLAGNMALSPDAMVLVPPKIDKSNIIGNPLAIVERNIYLECPVSGIPQPTVSWTKDGNPVDVSDSRIVFAQNNQTFGIEGVRASDQARYTCIASNKGGSVEQDFNLEVLTPPALESTETQAHTKREGDALSITCPIRSAVDATSAVSDVSWIKDGRPIERDNTAGVKISSDGRRLQIPATSLSDAGLYTCVAINRAGESSLDFKVEILCTHLGSQKCRDLEDRHRATYQHIRVPTNSSSSTTRGSAVMTVTPAVTVTPLRLVNASTQKPHAFSKRSKSINGHKRRVKRKREYERNFFDYILKELKHKDDLEELQRKKASPFEKRANDDLVFTSRRKARPHYSHKRCHRIRSRRESRMSHRHPGTLACLCRVI